MRRADREVTDVDGMIDIIDHCKVCHIALMDGEWPYIVAMNFAYSYENDQLVIYLHSAKEGKKLDLLRKDDHVCFEMDYDHEMIPAKYACAYNFRYASVVGRGHCEIITDVDEKIKALELLMKHQTGEDFVMEAKHTLVQEIQENILSTIIHIRRHYTFPLDFPSLYGRKLPLLIL